LLKMLFRRPLHRLPDSWFWLHLLSETICGAVAGLIVIQAPSELRVDSLLLAGAFAFFWLVTLIDLKHRLVLNVLVYPALLITVGVQVMAHGSNLRSMIIGGLMAFGIFYLTARLRPDELGGVDIKLATLIGLGFGFPSILWALLLGVGSGGVIALLLMVRRRLLGITEQMFIPYAPFLCLGAILMVLYAPIVRG